MASYLQSIGVAEIIPLIYRMSVFAVHPDSTVHLYSKVCKSFEVLVKSFDLKMKPLVKGMSFQNRKRSTSHNSASLSAALTNSKRQDAPHLRQNLPHDERAKWSLKHDFLKDSRFFNKHVPLQPKISPVNPLLSTSGPTNPSEPAESNQSKGGIYDSLLHHLSVSILGLQFHDENEIDWEKFVDTISEYSLLNIISLFDGHRSLNEVINLIPIPLREYGLDIVVFLLR